MNYILLVKTHKDNIHKFNYARLLFAEGDIVTLLMQRLSFTSFAEGEDALIKLLGKVYDIEKNTDEGVVLYEEKIYHKGSGYCVVQGTTFALDAEEDYFKYLPCYEYCNECDNESELVNYFAPQRCTDCGRFMLPCNLCEEMSCDNCPLAELLECAKESNCEIVFDNDTLRVDDTYLTCIEEFINIFNIKYFIGRKVFWLDPCFFRKEYHTSTWATIESIEGDIVTLDNGTECFLNECYI